MDLSGGTPGAGSHPQLSRALTTGPDVAGSCAEVGSSTTTIGRRNSVVRAHAMRCSGAAGGGALRVVYLPYRTHWGVAEGLYALGLHRDEALWHEPCDGALGHGPSPPPRAKL